MDLGIGRGGGSDSSGGSNPGNEAPGDGGSSDDSGAFDPSTFSWNQLTYLREGGLGNADISGWSEASKITSFAITHRQGICIDHTMKNNWGGGNIFQGNPWIFVPMDGKIYAATYEHLRNKDDPFMGNRGGQVCKRLSKNSLIGTLSAIGPHIKISPFKEWMPNPGDIVGFAVSTHARYGGHDRHNGGVRERSNIVWVRILDYQNNSEGVEVIGYYTNGVFESAN